MVWYRIQQLISSSLKEKSVTHIFTVKTFQNDSNHFQGCFHVVQKRGVGSVLHNKTFYSRVSEKFLFAALYSSIRGGGDNLS